MDWWQILGAVAGLWFVLSLISMIKETRAEVRAIRETQLLMLRAETYDVGTRHDALMKAIEQAQTHGDDP